MKNKKSIDMPLGIVIDAKRDGDYFHINGYFVTLTGNKVLGFCSQYDTINGVTRFDNLMLLSQGDMRTRERLYGFEVEYRNVYSVDAGDAAKMTQTLTFIGKRLAKMREMRGYADSFGEFCGRVAEAVSTKKHPVLFLQVVKPGGWHHDTEYRYHSIGDGVRWIDSLVTAWQDELKEASVR